MPDTKYVTTERESVATDGSKVITRVTTPKEETLTTTQAVVGLTLTALTIYGGYKLIQALSERHDAGIPSEAFEL
jgi:ethanolamine transporter EutH